MRSIATTSILAACFVAALVPALAQISPGDTGAGISRGLTAMNGSGQVGRFFVFRGSSAPLIRIDVQDAPHRAQAVTISRGSNCNTAEHAVGIQLGNALRGQLDATSPLPFDRLMSGNYSIVVHNNTATSQAVACGEIYPGP